MTSLQIQGFIGSVLLFGGLTAGAMFLVDWKRDADQAAATAAASAPEPVESVTVAVAGEREHRRTTTAIGTVLALRSVVLSNEFAGTVKTVHLPPGEVVEEGAVLVTFDVSVEEAELAAARAEVALAATRLERMQRASETRAVSVMEVDSARAERDVAAARIARTEAIIAKKTIRAPFRARIGLSDVHPGQYLAEGAQLTTLQGVAEAVHVDFTVTQKVGAGLAVGDPVQVVLDADRREVTASIVAVDAKVDPVTRNAMVRARLDSAAAPRLPAPGASVRVLVPVGAPTKVVTVPVSALRKGPEGDHVYVVGAPDDATSGAPPRVHVRAVESGTMLGDEVVIHSGVAAGERVAASGSFKLREGALVAVVGDDPGVPR